MDPVNKIAGQKAKHVNDKPGSKDSNNCVKSEGIFKTQCYLCINVT
jgi:hypothetical protein